MLNLRNVKLTYKRIIVRLSLITLFASGVTLPAFVPSPLSVKEVEAQPQTCSPYGIYFTRFYDWIANGDPSDSACWNDHNASVVSTMTCGFGSNAWEFHYGGSIYQIFTVPTGWTGPNFEFRYLLDFDDPNNDGGWNRFSMDVKDLTTGALLAHDYYDGSMGDLYCSLRSYSWSQNLAGHQILVSFNGSSAYTSTYTSTYIRVRSIKLFQQVV